jgi:hypothetical protein
MQKILINLLIVKSLLDKVIHKVIKHYRFVAVCLMILAMMIFVTTIKQIQWIGWFLSSISTAIWIYDCKRDMILPHDKYSRMTMELIYLVGSVIATITWLGKI